jgi:hypothetical protein
MQTIFFHPSPDDRMRLKSNQQSYHPQHRYFHVPTIVLKQLQVTRDANNEKIYILQQALINQEENSRGGGWNMREKFLNDAHRVLLI